MNEHMGINFDVESSAMHRKLQSKNDALKIMRTELEKYRIERDQFKLMAETLQLRYSAIKNSLNTFDQNNFNNDKISNVGVILSETRGKNMTLQTEVEALRQKVSDLQGDIACLRKKNVEPVTVEIKQGGRNGKQIDKTEGQSERSNMIAQMEVIKKKNAQLQYDFRSLLDEKEEVVTERDAYKCKVHRLNHELNVALQGDKQQSKFIDVDALILENKYLQERIANSETEVEMLKQNVFKYKTMLEAKKNTGSIKLGNGNDQDKIMSHKQVKSLLENGTSTELPLKAATISDLKSLCLTLLDNLNDKNLALSHQKKTNKLLATKIADLEQKLQTYAGGKNNVLLSPSQLLLSGYTSSNVDDQTKELILQVDIKSYDSKLVMGYDVSDSNKSQFSSEMEEVCTSDLSSEYTANGQQLTGDDATGVRLELEDLPPEIARLVAASLAEDHDN